MIGDLADFVILLLAERRREIQGRAPRSQHDRRGVTSDPESSGLELQPENSEDSGSGSDSVSGWGGGAEQPDGCEAPVFPHAAWTLAFSASASSSADNCLDYLDFSTFLKGPGKRMYAEDDDEQFQEDETKERPCKWSRLGPDGSLEVEERVKDWGPKDMDEKAGFNGRILRYTRRNAIDYAHRISALPELEDGITRFKFYVDGSVDRGEQGRPGAFSVVFKKPGENNEWLVQSWFIESLYCIQWAEMMAIAEALNMTVLRLRLMLRSEAARAEIYVFTDSLNCLDLLLSERSFDRFSDFSLAMRPLRSFIGRVSSELLGLGVRLTLSFIPGHKHDVEGHILADEAAGKALVDGCQRLSELEDMRWIVKAGRKIPPHRLPSHNDNSDGSPPAQASQDEIANKHNSLWAVLHHRSASLLDRFA
ncbi:hypothetical protein VTK56DRAFT_8432 [Thermocarpiscus australiensis]